MLNISRTYFHLGSTCVRCNSTRTRHSINTGETVFGSIYPFDKGAGLVRIKTNDAIKKIKVQIGDTEIIKVDPTPKFARDIRKQGH